MNLQPHIKTLESVLAGRHPVTGTDVTGNPLDDGETLRLLMRTLQALQALQIQLGGKGSMAAGAQSGPTSRISDSGPSSKRTAPTASSPWRWPWNAPRALSPSARCSWN